MELKKIKDLSYSGTSFDGNIKTTYRELSFSSSTLLTYEHITYSVSQGKKAERKYILNDLNGRINFGEVTAIVGHSGSGKTSLMNILSGNKDFCSKRKQTITGKIFMNGKESDRDLLRKISGFIMQQDELFPVFTVKETLIMAGNLKLSEKIPMSEKQQIIQEYVEKVGLDNCQDTKVKNISSGQRKRLCIALELINNPLILFLDEPTSGLDSTSSYAIITLLKSLACTGCAIVCSIHQPSSRIIESFNQLTVLTNGKCIYQGVTEDLMPYLSSLNFHCPKHYTPIDFVLNLTYDKKGNYLETLLSTAQKRESNDFNYSNNEIFGGFNVDFSNQKKILTYYQTLKNKIDYPTCNWTQYRVLLKRELLSSFRNTWIVILRFLFTPFIGILIGILCFDIGNDAKKAIFNIGSLFYTQLFNIFITSTINLFQFPVDRKIIVREQMNNWYRLKNYFFAKTTVDLPIQAVSVVTFCTAFYWMTSQPNELFRYLFFIGNTILLSITSMAFGMLFGAGTSALMAVLSCFVCSIPIVACGGFFIRFPAFPIILRWLASASFLSYGFEGCIIAIYGYNRSKLECKDYDVCILSDPVVILNELGINNRDIYIDFIVLLVFFFIFLIISYIILYWKIKR